MTCCVTATPCTPCPAPPPQVRIGMQKTHTLFNAAFIHAGHNILSMREYATICVQVGGSLSL